MPKLRCCQFPLRGLFRLTLAGAVVFAFLLLMFDVGGYRIGHRRGVAEAEIEMRQNRLTIYRVGLTHGIPAIDSTTGLPYTDLGCVVNERVFGRMDGHNERIIAHLQRSASRPLADEQQRPASPE